MSWMRSQFNPKLHTLFLPENIEKYRGNVPIVMRSKYERKFAIWCDKTSKVSWWSSENMAIPYYNPIKKRKANYWPDFIININDKVYIIELKPGKETKPPVYSKRKSLLREQLKYKINIAKWNSCKEYCNKYGYTFMVITNENLQGKQ